MSNNSKKILFLGYNEESTSLINELKRHGCHVEQRSDKLKWDNDFNEFDLIISFGYRHIIPGKFLERHQGKVINLHISYLPYNKGAHPNFWAFYDGTPHGVTIHFIDEGLDTGDILFQKEVIFANPSTFAKTYSKLVSEIEYLFIENIEKILNKNFSPEKQQGKGTCHKSSDLPYFPGGWDAEITPTISALKNQIT